MDYSHVPTFEHVRIRYLDYLRRHPDSKWVDINAEVHPGKPSYTSKQSFDALYAAGLISRKKFCRTYLYFLTPSGFQELARADVTKWACDLADFRDKNRASTLGELEMMLVLAGQSKLLDDALAAATEDARTIEMGLVIDGVCGSLPKILRIAAPSANYMAAKYGFTLLRRRLPQEMYCEFVNRVIENLHSNAA